MARTDEGLRIENVRRSDPVDAAAIAKVYAMLQQVRVEIKRDPESRDLRVSFATVRSQRTKVTMVLVTLKARLAGLRGDLIRVERIIEHNSSYMLATGEGLTGCKNTEQRKARIKVDLEEWYEARAVLRDEVQFVEEAVSSTMIVREELRYAYEEASRSLASIQLEYQIESSAP